MDTQQKQAFSADIARIAKQLSRRNGKFSAPLPTLPAITPQTQKPLILVAVSNRGPNYKTFCQLLSVGYLYGCPERFIWAPSPNPAIDLIQSARGSVLDAERPTIVHFGLGRSVWPEVKGKPAPFVFPAQLKGLVTHAALEVPKLIEGDRVGAELKARIAYQNTTSRGKAQESLMDAKRGLDSLVEGLKIPGYGDSLPKVTIPRELRETLATIPEEQRGQALRTGLQLLSGHLAAIAAQNNQAA